MQGQDLPGVLASAVLRTPLGVDAVLADLDAGRLVRGYPMRGTVFLLPAADAAWITELCARPSVRAASARSHQLDLDEATRSPRAATSRPRRWTPARCQGPRSSTTGRPTG